jgi:DNA replication and repair protein RecF
MYLQQLKAVNFKNYAELNLDFSPRINAIVGMNGVGKTNILEAIHYLCVCKSNFHASDRPALRKDADFFRLEGLFYNKAFDFGVDNRPPFRLENIACTYSAPPKAKKTIFHDGQAYPKFSEHIGRYPLVFIAPDDTRLLTEGSTERRQFLDISLSQLDPTYLRHLIDYNKLLEQRNALLKQATWGSDFDKLLLVYAEQMSIAAAYIYAERQRLTVKLIATFQHYYAQIVAGSDAQKQVETVHIDYESVLHQHEAQPVGEYCYQLFAQNLLRDKQAQRTTQGIHTDDLACLLSDLPVKQAASQGQRKSYLLALKLAQYALFRQKDADRLPLLLLDDIFDKLDAERVQNLLHIVTADDFGQIFITDTNANRLTDLLQNLRRNYTLWQISPTGASKLY